MKKKDKKQRLSLALLFSAVVFCILLAALLLSGLIIFLIVRADIFSFLAEPGVNSIIPFMMVISMVIGSAITVLAVNIPLKPLHNLIDCMNRLSSGDFKTRLNFGKVASKHSPFIEISGSFNKLAEELDNTEMLRSDFINNFSHEFKTPIVSIAGFAKLLKRDNISERQKAEYIDIIEEESLRLSYMATNVLNLTKAENQTILTEVTEFNLSEQLRSCVLLLEDKWGRKNLEFDLQFREYNLFANEELLKQVWINLIDNGIKFSPDEGIIGICIDEEPENIIVAISNAGPEIPPEQQKRIFNKFYQGEESHAMVGNGIGLAIVKHIVELHRGSVSVSSARGINTFRVRLPKKH